jgi:division protein CdvB (Snf7/Vps24/ESCRT-III family)
MITRRRFSMELNGVANIKMLVDVFLEERKDLDQETSQLLERIVEQTDHLERYMMAVEEAWLSNSETPPWHEVRDNPERYRGRR